MTLLNVVLGFKSLNKLQNRLNIEKVREQPVIPLAKPLLPSEEQAMVPKETALMSGSSTSFGGAQLEFTASKTKLGAQARTAPK